MGTVVAEEIPRPRAADTLLRPMHLYSPCCSHLPTSARRSSKTTSKDLGGLIQLGPDHQGSGVSREKEKASNAPPTHHPVHAYFQTNFAGQMKNSGFEPHTTPELRARTPSKPQGYGFHFDEMSNSGRISSKVDIFYHFLVVQLKIPQQSHPLSPLHEPLHWRAKTRSESKHTLSAVLSTEVHVSGLRWAS